jgi:tyrosyl-tRNA synthetase
MKVITDEKLIDKFLTRGVEKVLPTAHELKKKLMSGDRIKVYQGFDPTGPYLHVGHAMGIRALRILQQLGHEVIFLVGDFTARVGDPDKDKTRAFLTLEQIEANMKGWKEQAAQLIDFEGENPVKFGHNFDWLSKLNAEKMIEITTSITIQQLIERDLFQKKLKENKPIQLREFLYPLLQGYDSVAMEVDLEIGGADQIFNMMIGRDLVKKYLNKEKFVRANEMMEAPDALTMSKTKGNGINLADDANDVYGKAMSYPDELIFKCMRLLTDIEIEDIYKMEQEVKSGRNPMEFKKVMAFEIVKLLKGEKSANNAEKHFEDTIQNKKVSDEDIEKVSVVGTMTILEFLRSVIGEKESLSQVRRVIEQGGVEVNNQKIAEAHLSFNFVNGTVVKYGKRKFYKVEG